MRGLVPIHPCQYLVLWIYRSHGFNCISLKNTDVWHLLMCLLVIYTSSFLKCTFAILKLDGLAIDLP